MEDFKRRIGTFFILFGTVLLILFFASDSQGNPALWYLFWGSLSFFGGGVMAWRSRRPPQKAERFRTVKRLMGGSKNEEPKKKDGSSEEEASGDE